MADDDIDMTIKVPISPILEELSCPICFSTLKNATTTPCGHSFCQACIAECLDRKDSCPFCNKPSLRVKELIRNHSLDALIALLAQQKEQALNSGDFLSISKGRKLNPIESCFNLHMRRVFAQYDSYYAKLQRKLEVSLKDLQQSNHNEQELVQIETELRKTFDDTVSRLVEAFNKYLEKAPLPSFLPVVVDILLDAKQLVLKDILISPTDTIKDVRMIIQQKISTLGDQLESFTDKNIIVLKRAGSNGIGSGEEIIFVGTKPLLLQCDFEHGSKLILKGELNLRSEKPKQCFKLCPFVKGETEMTYYTCATCDTNWLCTPCAESCHQGHKLTLSLRDHKSTWACCYCSKKTKCLISK